MSGLILYTSEDDKSRIQLRADSVVNQSLTTAAAGKRYRTHVRTFRSG